MQVYDIIKLLEQTSSTNAKLEILREHKDNEELRVFFYLALSPEEIFYIKKIPKYFNEDNLSLSWGMNSLYSLSSREYTGDMGINYLCRILSCIIPENANLIERIIRKDPDCGVDYKTVNKIWPNLIKVFPVALCERNNEKTRKNISFPAFIQTKMDGLRVCVIVENGNVSFRSRNGKLIDLKGCLEKEFISMAGVGNFMFDGEAICYRDGELLPRKESNGLINKSIKGTIALEEAELIHIVLWDMIPLDDFWNEKCTAPYNYRLSELEDRIGLINSIWDHPLKFCKIELINTQVINSWNEAEVIFQEYLSEGLEGCIVKEKSSIWDNKRLKNHIKLKAEKSADLLCVGVEPHSKNPDMIGSLILQTSCGKLECGCGSGLTDKDRLKPKEYFIDKVVEVKYNEIIEKENSNIKSLFLPIYKTVRLDKSTANSLEELV
ncbi:MAG: hypothetical protein WC055_00710 [Melioribacteraceae bacterium]